MLRILRYLLLTVVVLLLVVGSAAFFMFNQWSRGVLPQHNGTLNVAGVQAKVEILRDSWGVPHIFAGNLHDLYFAQGYTQAQDRWWQMEFARHIGSGTIQELIGKNADVMATDIFIRQAGWRRAAERDWALLQSDPIAPHLQAFADGVNAYIGSRSPSQLAFEYNILGTFQSIKFNVAPWTPVDTLVWIKVMAWNLGGNQDAERFMSALAAQLGTDLAAVIDPSFPYGEKPTIIQPQDLPPAGEPFQAQTDSAGITGITADIPAAIDEGLMFGRGRDIGSNDWVVSGERSATGKPLLADDPHLAIQMPSIWYEIGLHCQPVSAECPVNVRGFTFSPAIGVVIGHNDYIAWGVTNVGWDTQDLYTIKVNPDRPQYTEGQYEYNGEWRDFTYIPEVIHFGDTDETVTIQVRETVWGTIINDYSVDEEGNLYNFEDERKQDQTPLAMRWTATQEPSTMIKAIFDLNTARNWTDFHNALQYWETASQNFVYADVEGNIGYQTSGYIPIRAAGHTGLLPVDGSTDAYMWKGYVPYEYLPSVLNPERGYIATANQALVPEAYYASLAQALGAEFGEDSHYVFGYQWAAGYRGQRIVELLEATDQHTFESFEAIHGDNKFIFAEETAPIISQADMGDAALNELRDWLFTDWDYQMHQSSAKAALYGAFWGRLVDNLFNDELATIGESTNGNGNDMLAARALLQDLNNIWWDDLDTQDTTETAEIIIRQSFREAYDLLVKEQGADRNQWRWGKLHTATFESNPLGFSGISFIENIVNRGPVETSGGTEIVNATGWRSDYTVRALPSMRMIVDLSNFENSVVIHTTGQSGHPYSEHYGDMIEKWRNIEYRPMLWTRAQIEADLKATLILEPAQ